MSIHVCLCSVSKLMRYCTPSAISITNSPRTFACATASHICADLMSVKCDYRRPRNFHTNFKIDQLLFIQMHFTLGVAFQAVSFLRPANSMAPVPNPSHAPKAAAKTAPAGGPLSDPLVPIRLELEVDGKPVQETFTWNSLETEISPRMFATVLAADLGLPEATHEDIASAIQDQIDAFVPAKRRRMEAGESRQVVRLDIRIGRVVIRDQFEWDLNATDNCPESFAAQLCAELGLSSEFVAHVAHAVREQLNELSELEDKRPSSAPLTTKSVVRSVEEVAQWEPVVECLSVEDQIRLERKEKREARLQRRNRGKADVFGKPTARIRYHDPSTARRRSSTGSLIDDSGSEAETFRLTARRSDSRRRRR